MRNRRHEAGYTLIEMLIGALLLTVIATTTYYLLNALDRGLSLLQGQMEAQQNPRAGMSRVIADLQESAFVTVTPTYSGQVGYTPTLDIQVIGTLCSAVSASSKNILVDNANGLAPGLPITIYTGTQTLSATSENVILTNAAIAEGGSCLYNANIGNSGGTGYGNQVAYTLTITTGLQNSYPWGSIVIPATAQGYTAYTITASLANPVTNYGVGRYVSQTGGTENASITGFSAPGFGSALSQNASAGTTTISVLEQNNACPFTLGDFVYINPVAGPVGPLQVTGVTAYPPSEASCVLTLAQALSSAEGAGTYVETMPNYTTLSHIAKAGDTQITVNNPITNNCVFNVGDIVVIDPGPYQEVRALTNDCAQNSPSTGSTWQYALQPSQSWNAFTPGGLALIASGNSMLSFTHGIGAIVLRKGTQVGIQSGYLQNASGGGFGSGNIPGQAPSDTYFSEGFGRN